MTFGVRIAVFWNLVLIAILSVVGITLHSVQKERKKKALVVFFLLLLSEVFQGKKIWSLTEKSPLSNKKRHLL